MAPTHPDGCDDFHRTLVRRAFLRRGAESALPVPDALLDQGAPRFLDRPRSRREVLAGAGGLMLALAGASRLDPLRLFETAAAHAAADPEHPILVLVYLDGGNDGLNTLVPLQGPDRAVYESLRRRLAIAPGTTLALPGRPDLGWHPALGGLKALYDAGKVAAIPACDYPEPDFSHFHSAHYWRAGALDLRATTGWLGRYLDVAGSADNPLQGVAVQWGTDEVLASRRNPTCAIFSPGDFQFWSPGVWHTDLVAAVRGMAAPGRHPALRAASRVARQSHTLRNALRPLADQDEDALPPRPVPYPEGSDLGTALGNLGRMLGAGLGVRVATVVADGGYDTHDGQAPRHAENLQAFGDCMRAWQADLAARGLARRVLTLVWSEFGRRVEDNDSGGTDHGAGGLLLAIGDTVRGGVHDDRWHLERLDDGNIHPRTDFRDVYAGVLAGHLRVDPRDVLPGYRGAPHAVVR